MLFLEVNTGDPNSIVNTIIHWFTQNGLEAVQKIVIAIIVLWLGFKIIKIFKRNIKKAFEKQNLDATLQPVILSVISVVLKILLIIAVISYIGIPMTSFVALLGAAGLAVGMALSGTIQNFAGGIIILVFRPFKLGDYIETQGFNGVVETIHIFSTTIRTYDNKLISLPNGTLSGGNIVNHFSKPTRRIEVVLEVASGKDVDIDKIHNDLTAIASQNEFIIDTPQPTTLVTIGPGTVSIKLQAWCNTNDYWKAYDQIQRSVYKYNVDNNLPCPYTVVGMFNEKKD